MKDVLLVSPFGFQARFGRRWKKFSAGNGISKFSNYWKYDFTHVSIKELDVTGPLGKVIHWNRKITCEIHESSHNHTIYIYSCTFLVGVRWHSDFDLTDQHRWLAAQVLSWTWVTTAPALHGELWPPPSPPWSAAFPSCNMNKRPAPWHKLPCSVSASLRGSTASLQEAASAAWIWETASETLNLNKSRNQAVSA